MNAAFGIDHPLIAVHDLAGLRERLIALGFNMTAIGRHPWGTSTSLAMFEGCLIEIMGIHDDTRLDLLPAGDFRFGRHVHEHLQRREGVALTALHSTDWRRDAERARAAGWQVSGQLEFGRDVELPDGRQDRTATTLVLLPDRRWPRLSLFLCQQHRPELIYVPQWLDHPNGVSGIAGITILAERSEHAALAEHFGRIYGPPETSPAGWQMATANGLIRLRTRDAIAAEFGPLPAAIDAADGPCIVAMDLRYTDDDRLQRHLAASGADFARTSTGFLLGEPAATGNTWLRFVKS